MATWQKLIFSGSNTSDLSNDSQFTNLTEILGVTQSLSSSMSTAREALSGEVDTLSGSLSTARDGVSSNVSGAFGDISSSFSTRVTSQEDFSSSLDDTFLTEQELNDGTGSILDNASAAVNVITLTKGDGTTFDVEVVQSGVDTTTASRAETAPFTGVQNKPADLASGSTFSSPSQGTLTAGYNGVTTNVDLGVQTGDSPTFAAVTTTGNAQIDGTLTVDGTTTAIGSATASLADKFVTFASGSLTASDGGIVIQQDVNGTGKGFGYNTGSDMWGFEENQHETSSTINHDANVNLVTVSASAPGNSPTPYGVGYDAAGQFWVDTNTNFIYISQPEFVFQETHYLTNWDDDRYVDFGGRTSGFYEQGQNWSYGWIQQSAPAISFADYINFSTDDFAIGLFNSDTQRYSRNINTTGENSLASGQHNSYNAFQGEDCWMYTFDGSTIKGYLNGTEVFSSTTLTRMPSSGAGTGDIFFGSDKMNNSDSSAYNVGARSFFISDQVLPASVSQTAFDNGGDITGDANYDDISVYINVTSNSIIDLKQNSNFSPSVVGALTFNEI